MVDGWTLKDLENGLNKAKQLGICNQPMALVGFSQGKSIRDILHEAKCKGKGKKRGR